MEYLHGHTYAHNHATEHMHGHDVHNHDAEYIHEHRSFVDILQIIESSSLTERAKKTATDIFRFWRMQKQKHMACQEIRCIFMKSVL